VAGWQVSELDLAISFGCNPGLATIVCHVLQFDADTTELLVVLGKSVAKE
jgi:hypothetical protein